MIDLRTGSVDLHGRVKDRADCRDRGCSMTLLRTYIQPYILTDDGDVEWSDEAASVPRWAIYHATAERYGLVPVHQDFVDEPALLAHAIDIAHDAMDHAGEQPA